MTPAEVVRAYHTSLRHGAYWCWLCGRELGRSDGSEAELQEAVTTLRGELSDPGSLRAFSAGLTEGQRKVPHE